MLWIFSSMFTVYIANGYKIVYCKFYSSTVLAYAMFSNLFLNNFQLKHSRKRFLKNPIALKIY